VNTNNLKLEFVSIRDPGAKLLSWKITVLTSGIPPSAYYFLVFMQSF